MRKEKLWVSHLFSTSSVVLLFIVWTVYSIQVNNPILMPKPQDVFTQLFNLFGDGHTYIVILQSVKRLLISLTISTILGTGLGLISGMKYQVEAFLKPIVIGLRSLPVLSVIVVVLILFGNTLTLYIISFLLLFPIIYQAELDGIKNIHPLLIDVLRLECTECTIGSVKMVFFPLSLPFLRTAIIEATGLAIKVLVIAEYISQTKVSVGREIYMAKVNLEYSLVFAWTFVLLLIVLIIEHFVEKQLKTLR